jgi:glycosyltransferase involved in cell wall biosynthesis
MIKAMLKVAREQNPRIAIVIPTLNRPRYLDQLLENISKLLTQPIITLIIDASENVYVLNPNKRNTKVIASSIRSAAIQRNIGIEYLAKMNLDLDYLAFLDDDVRVSNDYFQKIHETFEKFSQAVGVSGIALSNSERGIRQNRFWSLLGLTGEEGIITTAAINIPVRKATSQVEVDWLIGCSVWKWDIARHLKFQKDFLGQSVFEDVLFSVEASDFGKLIVDPKIVVEHLLAEEERPNSLNHYKSWVINRYRLKRIAPERFKLPSFLIVNFIIAVKLVLSVRLKGALGILLGTFNLIGIK